MVTEDYIKMIIAFIGGLGLFIYGMHIMATGLQKSAGSKMKRLLDTITSSKFLGVLVGVGFTAIIQSSSATTVMVVGFVNAGLMNLYQSVGVIMGANIGTTVTGWVVSSVEWAKYLSPSTIAPIAVGVGTAMSIFPKKDKIRQIGQIIAGFGIMFVGMNTMSSAVSPLRSSETFKHLFVTLGSNPVLGILAGALVTAVVQSSSASVGILQSLALSGLVPLNAAVYIIMGQNIGTCVTALISSIGATKMARSAAYIHLLFNVVGSVIFSVIAVIFFTYVNPQVGLGLATLTGISFVHTGFNVLNTVLFYPFSDLLVKAATKLANADKDKPEKDSFVHLDDRMLEAPTFAIENCIKEIVLMAKLSSKNLRLATEALLEKDEEKVASVIKREHKIDTLAHAITRFMIKLSSTEISVEQNNVITSLFHTVNDAERVGDLSENIAEFAKLTIEQDLNFSEVGRQEVEKIINAAISCYEDSVKALELNDKNYAKSVAIKEQEVDELESKYRENHIIRLSANECEPVIGVIFLDTMTNLERISDHALNIAEFVLKEKQYKAKKS